MAAIIGNFDQTVSADADYALAPFGPAETTVAKKQGPGFLRRFYDALIESRQRSADRIIARHVARFGEIGSEGRGDRPGQSL